MDNGNESAYPQSYIGNDLPHEGIGGGLTKRELFAAMAMQGLLSGENIIQGNQNTSYIAANAFHAVMIADALLAELAKEQP